MSIEIDFSGVEARRGGQMPDEGVYTFRIVKAETVHVGQKNTPAIEYEAEIVAGKFAGETVRFQKLWLTERALPGTLWALQAVGINPPGRFTLDPRDLLGRRFQASLYHEEYDKRDGGKGVKCGLGPWDPVDSPGSSGLPTAPAPTSGGFGGARHDDNDIPF